MNMTKTILPLILLASAASLGCSLPGVDDDAPESVASVAQATVYAPVMESGFSHSCAGKSDGTLYCWGYNGGRQLGDGTQISRSTPVLVSGITGAISIAAAEYHTCAVDSTSAVYCWGSNGNGNGRLGDGTSVDHYSPGLISTVSGLSGAVSVVAGSDHSCVLTSGGGVWCWGSGLHGQLGDGTATTRLTAVQVKTKPTPTSPSVPLAGAVAIAAGVTHTCAVKSSGEVWCWGDDTVGQLGDGLTTNSNWPVQVVGITNAVAATAGTNHSCALLSTGAIKCWGQASQGQLGDGTAPYRQASPVSVSGISTAVGISAGAFFTCAVLSGGTAQCWGYNGYRNLGDGTTTQQNSPVAVSGLSDGISIAAGSSFACALRSGGGVKCWGLNNQGNLGVGTTTVNTWPVDVLNLP